MKFTITRRPCAGVGIAPFSGLYGIFGSMVSDDSLFKQVTLEHAYPRTVGQITYYEPKLAAGTYTFVKRTSPHLGYVVWALEKAPDFQGQPVTWIEIHIGNYNKDSFGCTLTGLAFGTGMIEDSERAFDAFMEFTKNEETIEVTYV